MIIFPLWYTVTYRYLCQLDVPRNVVLIAALFQQLHGEVTHFVWTSRVCWPILNTQFLEHMRQVVLVCVRDVSVHVRKIMYVHV